jgi:phospholipid N-methyltransferase
MRRQHPTIHTIHGDAVDAPEHLREQGLTAVDAVVASLPWSLLERSKRAAILDRSWKLLTPGGSWVSFIYLSATMLPGGLEFLGALHRRPGLLRQQLILSNFPPAVSICCMR